MTRWRKVCCPVDFSAVSAAALEQAVEVVAQARGTLELVHVHPPLPPPTPEETLASHDALEQAAVSEERELVTWRERAHRVSRRPVAAALLVGDPAEAILRHARASHADLIVMGTHGRSGPGQVALGSVATRVALEAPCPVLVVPAARSPAVHRRSRRVAVEET